MSSFQVLMGFLFSILSSLCRLLWLFFSLAFSLGGRIIPAASSIFSILDVMFSCVLISLFLTLSPLVLLIIYLSRKSYFGNIYFTSVLFVIVQLFINPLWNFLFYHKHCFYYLNYCICFFFNSIQLKKKKWTKITTLYQELIFQFHFWFLLNNYDCIETHS